MKSIAAVYRTNPKFIKDILHYYFFKTQLSYAAEMYRLGQLKVSPTLTFYFRGLPYATSYKFENGSYEFEVKHSTFLMDEETTVEFPFLFSELIKIGYEAHDTSEMFDLFYKSKSAILIQLAEQLKIESNEIKSELHSFIKRSECNPSRIWQLEDFLIGNWNYTLLVLNPGVWQTAFDEKYFLKLFEKEKAGLDAIEEDNLFEDEYEKYIHEIDLLIETKLGSS